VRIDGGCAEIQRASDKGEELDSRGSRSTSNAIARREKKTAAIRRAVFCSASPRLDIVPRAEPEAACRVAYHHLDSLLEAA
jgi:hypothetical protein